MQCEGNDFGLLYRKNSSFCIYQPRNTNTQVKKIPTKNEKNTKERLHVKKADYVPVFEAFLDTLECSRQATAREILEYTFVKFNQSNQSKFEGHPLQAGDVIALRLEGEEPRAYYVDYLEFVVIEDFFDETFGRKEETELAVQFAEVYIGIQECTDGYDYTIYDGNYTEVDGGVYDNPEISIWEALEEVVTDIKTNPKYKATSDTEIKEMEYSDLMNKVNQAQVVKRYNSMTQLTKRR